MTLKDAMNLAHIRALEYEQYEISHRNGASLSAFLATLPENIKNCHSIVYNGMLVAGDATKAFVYPPGLMATSSVPEEAWLSEEELADDQFIVRSYNDDFDW